MGVGGVGVFNEITANSALSLAKVKDSNAVRLFSTWPGSDKVVVGVSLGHLQLFIIHV